MIVRTVERIKLWLGWCPRLDVKGGPPETKSPYILETQEGDDAPRGGEITYEERAPYSTTIKVLLSGVLLSLLALTALSSLGFIRGGTPVLLLATVILVFASWSFFNIKFMITAGGVEARMLPFTYRVPFEDIEDVRVAKIPWYVGWGLRIWGRRLAYVSMHKPAVMIEKKKGVFRTLVLTTEDPEKFAKMIRERMN